MGQKMGFNSPKASPKAHVSSDIYPLIARLR
jgi:hypothetical protein